jgi:hypothetical protein
LRLNPTTVTPLGPSSFTVGFYLDWRSQEVGVAAARSGDHWFRSPNVIDLLDYRSAADKQRIIEFMWQRQLRGVEFRNSI